MSDVHAGTSLYTQGPLPDCLGTEPNRMSADTRRVSDLEAPALAALEIDSIARALVVVDVLVKRAQVTLVRTDPVTPGKMLIVFAGMEEEVAESLAAAKDEAADRLRDTLLLPSANHALLAAIDGASDATVQGAVGVLEFSTACATLLASDAALKCAEVRPLALHLCRGIGGKGYFVFEGSQDAVEAALEAGDSIVDPALRVGNELIARPHPDFDWSLTRL